MITVDFKRLPVPVEGFRILDIGCGDGRHIGAAACLENVFVVGADRCFNDICAVRKRMETKEIRESAGSPWVLTAADITCLPFADEYFDLVICSEVLEHIPEDKKGVEELVRILKPGGNLVISVPNNFPESICWALSDAYHENPGGHIRIYRKKEIEDLVRPWKLTPRGFHYAHGIHTPYWWLKCLFGPEKDVLPVRLYHRLLVWDILRKPVFTRILDKILSRIMGKSMVFYFRK